MMSVEITCATWITREGARPPQRPQGRNVNVQTRRVLADVFVWAVCNVSAPWTMAPPADSGQFTALDAST